MNVARLIRTRLLVLLGLFWLLPPAAGYAQDEVEARQLFEAGRSAYSEGNFESALSAFQRSYELSHRPILLYNIGAAFDRLRRDEEAIGAYERYLSELPAAENRAFVEQRLAMLRKSVDERRAPTAAETAQAARIEESAAPAPPGAPAERPVYRKWWFWTSIGAVVAAGLVAGVLLAQPRETKEEGPLVIDGARPVSL